jgi:hypothetical protein
MPCLLNSPDSSNRSFHSRHLGTFRNVGTGEKKGCVAVDLVPRTTATQPFFSPYRAAILHYPGAFRFIRLCSCRARTKSGVREPSIEWDPRRQSRPHSIEGTRAYSRLTEVNPYSAPVIRGHMCLVCCKSRFSSCSPFASGEQSEKTKTDTPWLFAVFVAPVVLAPR